MTISLSDSVAIACTATPAVVPLACVPETRSDVLLFDGSGVPRVKQLLPPIEKVSSLCKALINMLSHDLLEPSVHAYI